MATKKSTAKKTTTISTRAERAKALRAAPSKVQKPLTIEQLIGLQEQAHELFERARMLRWSAEEKGASEAKLAALIESQDEARSAWMQSRFARWGAVEAERAIKRGKEPLPESLTDRASAGVAREMISMLRQQLAYERSKASPDRDRLSTIAHALKLARDAFEV